MQKIFQAGNKGEIFFVKWKIIEEKQGDGKRRSPNVGLEPTTLRLRVSCSTDWASRAICGEFPLMTHFMERCCLIIPLPKFQDFKQKVPFLILIMQFLFQWRCPIATWQLIRKYLKLFFLSKGPVAQRITRLTTDQKIAGSNPAWIDDFPFFLLFFLLSLCTFQQMEGP